MEIKRILRHLAMSPWRLRRAFPSASLVAIEDAIAASESRHGGELRFAVEGALSLAALVRGQSARERAIEVFSDLRIWDTEHNNGVLIYLLFADRDVEIVADRGIHVRVGQEAWEAICRQMEGAFQQGRFEAGVLAGIEAVTCRLVEHYPAATSPRGELPDKPVVL